MFDHQIVSLPNEPYQAVIGFFKSETNQALIGTWLKEDPSGVKGFVFFEDGSYLEIWDESRLAPYGYQDSCRLPDQASVLKVAEDYKAKPGIFPYFTVAGRKGWVGDSRGGVFFIWHEGPSRDSKKAGVREILKIVPPDPSGAVSQELVEDYEKAGLKIEFQNEHRVLIATDSFGVSRVAVARADVQGNGLVAVKFSRSGSETKKIPIYSDPAGRELIFMQLEPLTSTLVFRADLFDADKTPRLSSP